MRGFHFCIPSPSGNAGDDVLYAATRELLVQIGVDAWTTCNARDHVTDAIVAKANEHDLIVVGGGGMFLRDTNPNEVSGWQWKCPLELLKRFTKPLVVLAIGYNRFRGQEPFAPIFREHVGALLDRAAVFSVRNSGSRQALAREEGLPIDGVDVCPCPSLFIAPRTKRVRLGGGRRRVGLQLAGDRLDRRVRDPQAFARSLENVVAGLAQRDCEIVLMQHSWSAAGNLHAIAERLPNTSVYDASALWTRADIDRLLWTYRALDCVIAMRGHGQMIPFGQGTPVVSIITHDKLRWFLEDAGLSDWGAEADDGEMAPKVLALVDRALETRDWHNAQQRAMTQFTTQCARILERIQNAL